MESFPPHPFACFAPRDPKHCLQVSRPGDGNLHPDVPASALNFTNAATTLQTRAVCVSNPMRRHPTSLPAQMQAHGTKHQNCTLLPFGSTHPALLQTLPKLLSLVEIVTLSMCTCFSLPLRRLLGRKLPLDGTTSSSAVGVQSGLSFRENTVP